MKGEIKHHFHKCGRKLENEKLPADKRDIILLSYFVEMTDDEIGKELDTVRQNVTKRRDHILKLMRYYLERMVLSVLSLSDSETPVKRVKNICTIAVVMAHNGQ